MIDKWDGLNGLHFNSVVLKFRRESILIRGLQESGPQLFMHLQTARDDAGCNPVLFHTDVL
jgi:hypothetical protein